jgi:asparagine synthase (glutamine-hydrolysing)
VTVATDRFAVHSLCFAERNTQIFLADRADSLPLPESPGLDEQAIYDYVYFRVVPAPRTIFRQVRRLLPSRRLTFDAHGLRIAPIWRPEFKPDRSASLATLKQEFRDLAFSAVAREVTTPNIGAFLSGGTDSSTVAGMLGTVIKQPPATFSIGFDAAGYDEMSYARIAARHFRTEQHEYYVRPEDVASCIPMVACHYDQPFGNSSAVAAYLCARLAREHGVEKMLAGDGGDELFGGNSRYAKQKTFEVYSIAPSAVRRVMEALLLGTSARRLPLLRKIASYIEQARIPMPDRMETYNLLDRFGAAHVFAPRFLDRVSRAAPLELQREIYREPGAESLIDRMLAYDWRLTLADNDLPKVIGATRLAGEMVGFPLLDDDLLDFSLRLTPELKVRGLTLRYFFKEALRGFLPDEIIRKRKHGFGLPFGPWLAGNPDLESLARSSLDRLADRGIVNRGLTADLLSVKLARHPGYYGEMIWTLIMLEQWLQAKADSFTVR